MKATGWQISVESVQNVEPLKEDGCLVGKISVSLQCMFYRKYRSIGQASLFT